MLCIGCESGLLRNGSKLLRSGSGLVCRIVNRWYSAVLCGFVLMVGAAWRRVTPKWSEVTPKQLRSDVRSYGTLEFRRFMRFRVVVKGLSGAGLLRNGPKLLRSGSGLVCRIVNRWYSAVLCGFVLMVGAAWRRVTPKWSEVTPKQLRSDVRSYGTLEFRRFMRFRVVVKGLSGAGLLRNGPKLLRSSSESCP